MEAEGFNAKFALTYTSSKQEIISHRARLQPMPYVDAGFGLDFMKQNNTLSQHIVRCWTFPYCIRNTIL